MASRKVPVPRAKGGASAARRAASHPGVGGGGTSPAGPAFVSPFQPPAGIGDLHGDLLAAEGGWATVVAGGATWRVRVPDAHSLGPLVEAQNASGGERIRSMSAFLVRQMHPEDMATLLDRMADPDDSFDEDDYQELYRAAVTVGTARPFWQSSRWLSPPRITGGPCGPGSLWEV
jgi:hypothetical protein